MSLVTQEIIIMWALTGASVAIMAFRLIMNVSRRRRFDMGDYCTMAAIVTLLLRSSVENVPLVWGNNQVKDRATTTSTPQDIYRREVGSKLTMVNRVFYTVYVWLQKCVVMCILQQLFQLGTEGHRFLHTYWAILGVTFLGSIVSCFTECQPFQLYWQVVPDPGNCGAGKIQLFVFCILEMVTDVMLMILPLHYLSKMNRPWLARLRLIGLFLVGLAIVAVTMTRLIMNVTNYQRSGASHNIANIELFFSAFVANAPPIYGLINAKISSSTQRSRSTNNAAPSATAGGWQLDSMTSISTPSKLQKADVEQWNGITVTRNITVTRRTGEADSDEELIIVRHHGDVEDRRGGQR